jgi:hypothetical protein
MREGWGQGLLARIAAPRLGHSVGLAGDAGCAEKMSARRHPIAPGTETWWHRDQVTVAGSALFTQVGQHPGRGETAVLGDAEQQPAGFGGVRIGRIQAGHVAGRAPQQGGEARQGLHHVTCVPFRVGQARHASPP